MNFLFPVLVARVHGKLIQFIDFLAVLKMVATNQAK